MEDPTDLPPPYTPHDPLSSTAPSSIASSQTEVDQSLPLRLSLRGGYIRRRSRGEEWSEESYSSAAPYLEERSFDDNGSTNNLSRIEVGLHISPETTREDLEHPLSLKPEFRRRDVNEQDWATFVNYLLAELGADSQIGHHREEEEASKLDDFEVRQPKIESVILEWNTAFFEPRGISINPTFSIARPASPALSIPRPTSPVPSYRTMQSTPANPRAASPVEFDSAGPAFAASRPVRDGPLGMRGGPSVVNREPFMPPQGPPAAPYCGPVPIHHGPFGPHRGPFGHHHGPFGHHRGPFSFGSPRGPFGPLGQPFPPPNAGFDLRHPPFGHLQGPPDPRELHPMFADGHRWRGGRGGRHGHRGGGFGRGRHGRHGPDGHRHDEEEDQSAYVSQRTRRRSSSVSSTVSTVSSSSDSASISSISSDEYSNADIETVRNAIQKFRLDPEKAVDLKGAVQKLHDDLKTHFQEAPSCKGGPSNKNTVLSLSKAERKAMKKTIKSEFRELRREIREAKRLKKRERKEARRQRKAEKKAARQQLRCSAVSAAAQAGPSTRRLSRQGGQCQGQGQRSGVLDASSPPTPPPDYRDEKAASRARDERRIAAAAASLTGLENPLQPSLRQSMDRRRSSGGVSSGISVGVGGGVAAPPAPPAPPTPAAGNYFERLGRDMENWGERFGRDMEVWGERFGRDVEAWATGRQGQGSR